MPRVKGDPTPFPTRGTPSGWTDFVDLNDAAEVRVAVERERAAIRQAVQRELARGIIRWSRAQVARDHAAGRIMVPSNDPPLFRPNPADNE
jgi:hypothetical protein